MIVTPYNYLVSDCCSGNQYIVNMPSGALVGEMWYIQSVGGYNFCCIIEQILGLIHVHRHLHIVVQYQVLHQFIILLNCV
jgi:hypothetical protein